MPLLNTLCSQIFAACGRASGDFGCRLRRGVLHCRHPGSPDCRRENARYSRYRHLKSILRLAAKREKQVEFAVASCYHLPFADETADLLLDCFSPLAIDEFRRVLKPGGHFLYVVPGADHLWELKRVLYDAPYPNEEKKAPYEGLHL